VETHAFYQQLLKLRHDRIAPGLKGARAIGAQALGPKAVAAQWRLGDGARLTLALNLDIEAVYIPDAPTAEPLYRYGEGLASGELGGFAFVAWLETEA
jgi:maltooligosyltrehalose trehalohydrolase